AALQRFVFRSKVKLDVPARAACGAFAAPAAASGATTATTADGTVEFDFGDGQQPRALRICADGTVAPDEAVLARWRAADIACGLPRPGAATLEAWTPQQLSLDRLKAYSVRKGCYPGQEIVARTHFLGQAKRGLALFGCASPPAPGTEVMEGERAVGNVVCAAPAAGEPLAAGHAALVLAVLPLERADDAPARVA